jgi:formyl-CoA transferase
MGDFPSGTAIVAGVMTALFHRERTGDGSIVDVSLYGAGLWTNGWELQTALLGQEYRRSRPREERANPLYNCYRCAGDRWVQFAMFQAGRYWAPLCNALGRPDLIEDPRFADFDSILVHAAEATALLDEIMASLDLDELAPRLDAADLPWSPVLSLEEITTDEQARVNGMVRTKRHRSGLQIDTVAPPFQIRGQPARLEPAPEVGQHREEILLELGYDWHEITALESAGAF